VALELCRLETGRADPQETAAEQRRGRCGAIAGKRSETPASPAGIPAASCGRGDEYADAEGERGLTKRAPQERVEEEPGDQGSGDKRGSTPPGAQREEEDEREVENGVELDLREEACLDQGGEGDHEEDEGASA
jgi:hypothetical protein